MTEYIENVENMALPAIALRGLVVFPGVPTGFEIARPESSKAVEKAQRSGGLVFLVAQRDTSVDLPGEEDLYKIGTIAKIKQSLKLPDNTYRVVAEGIARAEMISFERGRDGVISVSVLKKEINLRESDPSESEAQIRSALQTLGEYLKHTPKLSNDVLGAIQSITSPGLLADFIATNILLKFQSKQKILAEFDPVSRLELLDSILEEEIEILRLQGQITRKVKSRVSANQRDYYLREQLKLIKEELGGDPEDDGMDECNELRERIYAATEMPEKVREKLLKEVGKLEKTPFGSAEGSVIRNYLDTCLEIPFGKYTKEKCDIERARKILDRDHCGLEKVKKRILEYLAVKTLSPDLKGQIICLVGPPGVGKTSIASSLARALNRKYVRVSLGGIRDESDIRGHRKTYIASMPGRIITALNNSKVMNPLMLLDEVDKMTKDAHGDPSSALLEVLDSEQNSSFRDHFIEFPVDLSECMFITTANTLDTIPRPLLDRMEVIHIDGYSESEKIAIAKEHLLPKEIINHGLKKSNIKITDEGYKTIIEHYTSESGVRNLKREIASLCRKVAMEIALGERKTHTVNPAEVKKLLGRYKIRGERMSKLPLVGTVNGLAWTQNGGELLKVEAKSLEGSGKIILTGSLGDVIKESANIAVSLVRSMAKEWNVLPLDFYKTRDLHIHFPEGAVPKDGPSAGVTLTTAIVSEITGRPVRHDVAMTGEIDLHGNVLPIGGLKEKSMAAYRNGIHTIIIPEDNLDDLEDIDSEVKEKVTFIPALRIETVLQNALSEDVSEFGALPQFNYEISNSEKNYATEQK